VAIKIMKLKYNQLKLRKKDDRYEVYDLPLGEFTFSITHLYPGKATTGHTQEEKEVYNFIDGHGQIQIGEDKVKVEPGDIVIIPEGTFHRVFSSMSHMVFACAFPNEELILARRRYSEALAEVNYLGAIAWKAEVNYSRVFAEYRESGGQETYGTSDGICKEAWEARERARKDWLDAVDRKDELWDNYNNIKEELMGKIYVHYCTKCKHNTPNTDRALTTAVGDKSFDHYNDVGPWREGLELRIKARQCLVCGKYFQIANRETELKVE